MTTHILRDVFDVPHEIDTEHLFVSSDLHLGHRKILDYCNRPFADVDAMGAFFAHCLDQLTEDDTLLLLGDITWRSEFLAPWKDLPCTILNVPGNHDSSHPMHHRHTRGAKRHRDIGGVYTLFATDILGDTEIGDVWLCHFPAQGDHTGHERFDDCRLVVPDDEWLLHGHLHGTAGKRTGPRSIDVGVDAWMPPGIDWWVDAWVDAGRWVLWVTWDEIVALATGEAP